ncbi:MAG: DUF1801 domain-containing protein [Actinomycetota bacterium]
MSKAADARSPEEYIARLDEPRRSQVQTLHEFIRRVAPDLEPHMRSGMIGYGTYHYEYASGRDGEWFVVGLAGNKSSASVHVSGGVGDSYVAEKHAARLGKVSVGKSCIRIKKIEDVDLAALEEVIREGMEVLADSRTNT